MNGSPNVANNRVGKGAERSGAVFPSPSSFHGYVILFVSSKHKRRVLPLKKITECVLLAPSLVASRIEASFCGCIKEISLFFQFSFSILFEPLAASVHSLFSSVPPVYDMIFSVAYRLLDEED